MSHVSVYMTVFNGEEYLPAAIESILGQSLSDFDFVIVDDGSTDGVPAILDRYRRQDSRIRVIRQENRGRPQALNTAWQAAAGALCANMDPDDVAEPFRLERQVAFLQAHPEVVAVGSAVMLVDPDGLPIREIHQPCTHEGIEAIHLSARSGAAIVHPAMMTRRDALLSVGGYDERYQVAQDIDLCLRLADVGRLANLDEVLVQYRQHTRSAGYAKRLAQHEAAIRAALEARKRRGLPPPERTAKPGKSYSETECHLRWSRWAMKGGHPQTARKHAWIACHSRPWDLRTWGVLTKALLSK